MSKYISQSFTYKIMDFECPQNKSHLKYIQFIGLMVHSIKIDTAFWWLVHLDYMTINIHFSPGCCNDKYKHTNYICVSYQWLLWQKIFALLQLEIESPTYQIYIKFMQFIGLMVISTKIQTSRCLTLPTLFPFINRTNLHIMLISSFISWIFTIEDWISFSIPYLPSASPIILIYDEEIYNMKSQTCPNHNRIQPTYHNLVHVYLWAVALASSRWGWCVHTSCLICEFHWFISSKSQSDIL